jgi:pimeloyl-ACP methyl ester carboxylesterase
MRFRRLCAAVLITAGALLVPAPAGAAPVTCEEVRTPVLVSLLPHTMYGKLCAPQGATTVMVLIPGGTYTSAYWDISYTPEIRSFRLAMNNAGIATLTLDRLGTGKSSKPLSTFVTAIAQADAAHQVIKTLRPRFQKVILGGHSIGSAMTMIEAGKYRDVDGVLITGMTHRLNLVEAIPPLAMMIPAPLDPVIGPRGLDPGYLTTTPGSRYSAFHAPGQLVSGAIDHDEATKDVFAVGEAVTTLLMTNVLIPSTRNVNVPVLNVVSATEPFCVPPLGTDCSSIDSLVASEAPFYPNSPRLEGYIVDNYGHSFNYGPSAPDYHAAVVAWARTI